MKEYIKPEFSFVAVRVEGAVICGTMQDDTKELGPGTEGGDNGDGDGIDYVDAGIFREGIWDED